MITKFKSIVYKANKQCAGFIRLPEDKFEQKDIGQQLKISIFLKDSQIEFYSKVRFYLKLGVYVPMSIVRENDLLSKKIVFRFEKVNGFFTKASYDGRIYLPQREAEKLDLKQNEIILIDGIIDNKKYSEFCQIKIRKKPNTTEYFCMFNPKISKKEGVFNIKSIISRNKIRISPQINDLIKNFNYAPLEKHKIVMYFGNRVPIVIKTNFDMNKLAYYLGCYFSDGTKKGNSWGICASTFEQANYFIQMHNLLIENPLLRIELVYTDPFNEDEDKLKDRLSSVWLKKTKLDIPKSKIWIYKTNVKDSHNRNVHGALSIREHRQLVLVYYNELLDYLLKEIVENENKKLALDFILGILEGDGAPSAKSRGHILIFSNKEEVKTLIKIFKVLNLKHKGYGEKKNKYYIRIGSIELIENIHLFKDKLFKYYPKRRKRLIERLSKTGTAMFLTGELSKTSPWILKRLREKGILTKDNKLTSKGKKIKKALLSMEKGLVKERNNKIN